MLHSRTQSAFHSSWHSSSDLLICPPHAERVGRMGRCHANSHSNGGQVSDYGNDSPSRDGALGTANEGRQGRRPTMSIDHKSQLRVHIRWMIRRDMPEVLEIERASFEFPWFEEDFIRCLRQRNCIGMVAEHAEHVVGFMIYELHKTRLHILNFAVSASLRHRSIGTQMIEKLVGKLSSQRR